MLESSILGLVKRVPFVAPHLSRRFREAKDAQWLVDSQWKDLMYSSVMLLLLSMVRRKCCVKAGSSDGDGLCPTRLVAFSSIES